MRISALSVTASAWLLSLSLAGLACSKPAPPTLVPESATVTAMTATGVDLRVVLDVTNPNAFALTAHAITAHLVLGTPGAPGASVDLGTTTIPQAVTFPAQQTTNLAVPVSLRWADLQTLGALAAASPSVPYAVDGSLSLGGGALDVSLPYRLTGAVSQAEVVQAALRSLPQLPGGFALPSALPGLAR